MQVLQRTLRELCRALRELRGAPRDLRSTFQVLQRTLRFLRGALRKLRGTSGQLRGAPEFLHCTLQSLRGALRELRGAPRQLRGALQFLRRALQVLQRTLRGLRGTFRQLRGAFQILQRALQILRGTLQVLRGALQILRGALQVLGCGSVGVGADADDRTILGGLVGNHAQGVGPSVPHRALRPVGIVDHDVERSILLADLRHPVDHHRTSGFGRHVPVAVGGHDGEVLLARKLDRVTAHATVDAVLLAGKVSTDPRQSLTGRRRSARHLAEQLAEPVASLRRIEIGDRQIVGAAAQIGIDGDETDTTAVRQWHEGEADGAFDQTDPGPVEGVPVGKILPFIDPAGSRCR
ncbi:MAG: hypothetical protein CAPSK01_000762 [Candidatus Accumulibacter vicinus]|uniref:Uncharacterized protein n=1 Tax=Candidatus Accumulibacter vicinus TaxID=2954382 RepID=A0A084Y455_9PROT|nr:MAG: hypothetical protein CAPSK01_000762 [Candidatus Accumulibacter vicinus]